MAHAEFTDEHEDSVIAVVLTEVGDGTSVNAGARNVPDDQRSYEEGGWQSNYFEPMVEYFAGLRGVAAAEPSKERANKAPPKLLPNAPPSGRQRAAARRSRLRKQNQSMRRRLNRQRKKPGARRRRAGPLRSLGKKPRRGRTNRPGANGDRGWTGSRSLEREPAANPILTEPKPRAGACRWLQAAAGRARQTAVRRSLRRRC